MGIFGGGRRQRAGTKKDSLMPENFDGDVLVVTVKGAPREFENFGRRSWAVDLVEHPDAIYYLTYAQMRAAVAVLGNDEKAWDGQRVALVATDVPNPSDGGTVRKFYPAEPAESERLIREYDEEQGKAAPKKPARTRKSK